MVFQTTPPQPASNARWHWYAVLEGGPEATQNGLGDLMPARFIERSDINSYLDSVTRGLHRFFHFFTGEQLVNAPRGSLAFGDGINDFLAAIGAVTAGKNPGQVGLAGVRV